MAEEKIYTINIDTDGATTRLDEVADALQENNKRVKELLTVQKEQGKLNAQQVTELARVREASKGLVVEQRNLIRVVNDNGESLDAQRAKLALSLKQYDSLSEAQKTSTADGKALKTQIDSLTQTVSSGEEATGRYQRSVGKYGESVKEALGGTKAFGGAFGKMNNVMKANPIVLIVSLLLSFFGAVGKSQFAVDAFNKVLEPLNAILQRTIGLFQGTIKAIAEGTFSFKAFGKQAKEALGGAVKEGQRLVDIRIEIEEGQIELIKNEAKLRREIEEQKEASLDLNKTQKERNELGKAAIKSLEKLRDAQLAVLEMEIEEAAIKASQNETDRKAKAELAKLDAQRDNLQAEFLRNSKEINSQLRSLESQLKAETKSTNAEREKQIAQSAAQMAAQSALLEAQSKAFTDLTKAELKENISAIDATYKEAEAARRELLAKELAAVAGNLTEEKIVRRTAEDEITGLKAENLARQITEYGDYADQVEGIDAQIEQKQMELNTLMRDERIKEFQTEYEKKKAIADQEIKDNEDRAKLQQQAFLLASQSIGASVAQQIENFEGSFADFQKNVARSILMTTLDVIQKQLIAKQLAAIADVGMDVAANPAQLLIAGFKIAGIATAFAVAKRGINEIMGFAGGGVIPSGHEIGYSNSKGDNVPILAKAKEMILTENQQASIRAMAGDVFSAAGVPNANRSGAFAGGGIVYPTMQSSNGGNAELLSAISQMQLSVSVTEISSKQNDVMVRENRQRL